MKITTEPLVSLKIALYSMLEYTRNFNNCIHIHLYTNNINKKINMNEKRVESAKKREEMQLKPSNDGKVNEAIFSIYGIIYYVEWSK